MDITEVTVVHHAVLVLAALWLAASAGWAHPALFLVALLYIFAVSAPRLPRIELLSAALIASFRAEKPRELVNSAAALFCSFPVTFGELDLRFASLQNHASFLFNLVLNSAALLCVGWLENEVDRFTNTLCVNLVRRQLIITFLCPIAVVSCLTKMGRVDQSMSSSYLRRWAVEIFMFLSSTVLMEG